MTTDFERIEELHQADMQASKERDYRALRSIMSDDAVVLPPGGRMIRGRDALDKSFASMAGAAQFAPISTFTIIFLVACELLCNRHYVK